MIPALIFALLFVILAVAFLMGKGDRLIAGYNTMSEEQRRQVDIHRLRKLMVVVSVLGAAFCALMPFIPHDIVTELSVTLIFILICIVVVILANTWAKKKQQ